MDSSLACVMFTALTFFEWGDHMLITSYMSPARVILVFLGSTSHATECHFLTARFFLVRRSHIIHHGYLKKHDLI